MALMRISEYQKTFSPGSRPDRRTVIAQIKRKELVGKQMGGLWYVDPDKEPPKPTIEETADALFLELTARREVRVG